MIYKIEEKCCKEVLSCYLILSGKKYGRMFDVFWQCPEVYSSLEFL